MNKFVVRQELAEKAYVLGRKIGDTQYSTMQRRLQVYENLWGVKLSADQRKAVKQAFADIEKKQDEANTIWLVSSEQAEEQCYRLFAPVIYKRVREIDALIKELVAGTPYSDVCEISLTECAVHINIRMPAYWSNTVTLSGRFEKQANFDISYGAGGHNSGYTSIELAKQKADALILACNLAERLAQMDWQEFLGYSANRMKVQREIMEQMRAQTASQEQGASDKK